MKRYIVKISDGSGKVVKTLVYRCEGISSAICMALGVAGEYISEGFGGVELVGIV